LAPATKPKEPKEAWPTYENIVGAWRKLLDQAQPGDQVFIYYAAHGGRTPTIYPQKKSADPKSEDESLVPTDIANSEARYVRDLEIAYLLRAMVKKKLLANPTSAAALQWNLFGTYTSGLW
jgi:hypothetical protein